jgi:hypothetical protein
MERDLEVWLVGGEITAVDRDEEQRVTVTVSKDGRKYELMADVYEQDDGRITGSIEAFDA